VQVSLCPECAPTLSYPCLLSGRVCHAVSRQWVATTRDFKSLTQQQLSSLAIMLNEDQTDQVSALHILILNPRAHRRTAAGNDDAGGFVSFSRADCHSSSVASALPMLQRFRLAS
jgi:hypothetical protein